MEHTLDDTLEFAFIVFQKCIEIWKISYDELAKMVEKYQLVTVIDNSFMWLNSMGIEGVVEELDAYIKRVDKEREQVSNG